MKLFEAQSEATLDGVRQLRQKLRQRLKNTRIDGEIAEDICLAVSEVATNAVVHANPGPTWLGLQVDISGNGLLFELADNGASFEAFEQLFRADARDALIEPGESGLGLNLIRQVLSDVSYCPGHPNVLRGRRKLYRARPAVLLLEDTGTLLKLYAAFLGKRFRVTTAQTIEAAREILLGSQPDLIVTDYHIGRDTAIDLLDTLNQSQLSRPIPVVLITQDREDATEQAILQAGVEQFLLKPVTPERLNRAVDVALSSHQKRLSHFFSYFGRDTRSLLSPLLPERLGEYHCRVLHGTALWGGGDFTLHLGAPERERLVLGDAMGHGLPAKATALSYAAMLRTVDALGAPNAASLLVQVSNAVGHSHFPPGMIATIVVADLLTDGRIEIASAGHLPAVILTRSGCAPGALGGPLPGFDDRPDYEVQTCALAPGDRLVLITDGLDPDGLADGSFPEAVRGFLECKRDEPLDALCESMTGWIAQVLGAAPNDDWTAIIIERAK
jgi:CheY-like chemotaxis protein/anti-sigma regulatory factor (Ser/Thr protein kinase)